MAERGAATQREITRTGRAVLEPRRSRFGKITHRSSRIATGMKAITFLIVADLERFTLRHRIRERSALVDELAESAGPEREG